MTKKPSKSKSFRTQAAFARELGVSQQTVSKYAKEPSWPVRRVAPWNASDAAKALAWIQKRLSDQAGGDEDLKRQQLSERVKLLKQRRASEAFDLKIKMGDYVSKVEVEAHQLRQIDAVRDAMMAVPEDLGPILANRDAVTVESVLKARMFDICLVFAGERKFVRTREELVEAFGLLSNAR